VRFTLTAAVLGVSAAWLSTLVAALVESSPQLIAVLREHGGLLCRALMVCSLVWLLVLAGELAERYLFFAAVVANRMPGGLST
jgi:hypothetical protein